MAVKRFVPFEKNCLFPLFETDKINFNFGMDGNLYLSSPATVRQSCWIKVNDKKPISFQMKRLIRFVNEFRMKIEAPINHVCI